MYRIISLRHTKKKDKFITLWGPDNSGYHFSKEMSGTYEDFERGYHDCCGNMPLLETIADGLFMPVVYEGKEKHMIPNCAAVWDKLGLKWKGNKELVRINY